VALAKILSLVKSIKESLYAIMLPRYSVSCSDAGFSCVQYGQPSKFVSWTQVEAIDCFKADRLSHDCVVFEIKLARNDQSGDVAPILIDEDMEGFDDFEQHMSKHLVGFEGGWRRQVIPEPFKANRRTVYRRIEII
jgi:hypothetical protein